MAKPRKPENNQRNSPILQAGMRLIGELHQRVPDGIDKLPPPIQKIMFEAIEAALEGDLDPIQGVHDVLDDMADDPFGMDAEMHDGSPEITASDLRLSSPRAAKRLGEIQKHLDLDRTRREVEDVLQIDPHSVEAMLILAESAPSIDERVKWFQRASEAASHHEPGLVSQVMPGYRMNAASRLIADGRYLEAAEIGEIAFQEDPQDRACIRELLVEVYLRLGWDDELQRLIERFNFQEECAIAFATAILAYKNGNDPAKATELLIYANSTIPGIVERLTGCLPVDWNYESGHFIDMEACRVAGILLPGVRDITGAMQWIRETFPDQMRAAQDALKQAAEKDDLFDDDPFELACDLEPTEGHWKIHVQKISQPQPAHIVVVLDKNDDVTWFKKSERVPKTDDWQEILLQAITNPLRGKPRKPRKILVSTKADQKMLAKSAGTVGIRCEIYSPSANQKKTLQRVAKVLLIEQERMSKPMDDGLSQASSPISWQAFGEQVQAAPESDSIWTLGVFQPPMYINDRATPRRSWITLLLDADSGMVIKFELSETKPTTEQILGLLSEVVLNPATKEPQRPRTVLLDPKTQLDQLSEAEQTGIDFVVGDQELAASFTIFIEDILREQSITGSSIRELDGIEDNFLAHFYKTCATFYRARPWRMVAGDQLFDVHCYDWEPATWSACVMGQMGQQLGINLFSDPSGARQFLAGYGDPTKLNVAAVQFAEAHECNSMDIWNLERMEWEVAANEAYPFVSRIADGKRFTGATAMDLQVLRDIMRHTPRFLDHPSDQPLIVEEEGKKIQFTWAT